MTQPTTTPFGQDIGVASAAGRRILLALLAKDQLDFPEWLTMTTVNNEDAGPRDALGARLIGLGLDDADAIGRLESRGVLGEESGAIELTADGQALYDRLAATVREIGVQILDGIPAEDVATTRRVLRHYTERANAVVGQR